MNNYPWDYDFTEVDKLRAHRRTIRHYIIGSLSGAAVVAWGLVLFEVVRVYQ